MSFEADFAEMEYIKKSWKLREPGPAVDVGEFFAKEIRTIE
jgi:hypothetical protein